LSVFSTIFPSTASSRAASASTALEGTGLLRTEVNRGFFVRRAIVAALRAGDADAAERLMEQHIQSGKARLLRTIAT
jgi:DNA-binding GntR family transcriptional regulator